jgi:hypothetical protein
MSFHPAVLEGLARKLDAAGIGIYRENGVFTQSERGIVVQAFPETPPEIIALTLYGPDGADLSPTASHRLAQVNVQIRYRLTGHPFTGIDLFDQLHDLIHRKSLNLGAVTVTGRHLSFAPMGQTPTGFEFTSNWMLTGLAGLPLVPSAG